MRLTRLRVVLGAGLVAAGAIAGTAVAATAAPAKALPIVMVQCNGAGQVKPSSTLQPGCMGSNADITRLKWSAWGSSAFASGTAGFNDCTPSASCGPNKFTKFPALFVLWRPVAWPKHHGREYFTRMTEIFTGSGKHFPKGLPVSKTYTLRASQP
jgi:hypothetical protein